MVRDPRLQFSFEFSYLQIYLIKSNKRGVAGKDDLLNISRPLNDEGDLK
jgi:hypothetical protein